MFTFKKLQKQYLIRLYQSKVQVICLCKLKHEQTAKEEDRNPFKE